MGTLIFQEVSAKTGKDINLLFTTHIYEQIAEKYKLKPNLKEQQKLSIPNQNEETSENIKNSNKKETKSINISLNTIENTDSVFRTKTKCCNLWWPFLLYNQHIFVNFMDINMKIDKNLEENELDRIFNRHLNTETVLDKFQVVFNSNPII